MPSIIVKLPYTGEIVSSSVIDNSPEYLEGTNLRPPSLSEILAIVGRPLNSRSSPLSLTWVDFDSSNGEGQCEIDGPEEWVIRVQQWATSRNCSEIRNEINCIEDVYTAPPERTKHELVSRPEPVPGPERLPKVKTVSVDTTYATESIAENRAD